MEPIIDISAVLAPIPGDALAGVNMAFSTEFGDIKEARRADEVLPQGDWELKDTKEAEWPKVKELTLNLLQNQTKDLQLLCWLTEALTNLHGVQGLYTGFVAMREVIAQFWDDLYPSAEDGLDARAGKLAFLDSVLPGVVASISLTEGSGGRFGLRHWNEARAIENARRKNPTAAEEMLNDGKIAHEVIDKSVASSSDDFYRTLHSEISACQESYRQFEAVIDEKFGNEAPSLATLRKTIDEAVQLVDKICREKGLFASEEVQGNPDQPTTQNLAGGSHAVAMGPIGSREDALRKLAEIANYFRLHEPHSPVAFLVDRAAKWGRMPFEVWLKEVIKDQNQLGTIYELLGVLESDNPE